MPHSLRHALGTLFLAGSVLLGGCSAISQVARTTPSHATLVLDTALCAAPPRRAQAVVPRLTEAEVDHLRLQLVRVTGETTAPVEGADGPLTLRIPHADLGRPIVLSQLHPQTRYRVVALAYQAPAESAENEISDPTSLEVLVGDDDRPTTARMAIQLKDVPFNGMATFPSFDVRAGGYIPDGVETVSMAEQTWVWANTLVWTLGASEDRMGPLSVGPDGQSDAHFHVTVDLPKGVPVQAISLFPAESTSETYWSTWEYGSAEERLLGVAQGAQALNADFASKLGSFEGPTEFDLYASSLADFPPGSRFFLEIYVGNSTVLYHDFTLPTQQEATP